MKRRIILLISALIISINVNAQLDRSIQPKGGPTPKIKLEKPQEFKLKNGIRVLVVENHKLPRVSYSLRIDNNPIIEGDKAGVTSLLGSILGNGTTTIPKDEFNEEIDFLGASLNIGFSGGFASTLSKNNERVVDLMTDAVINPLLSEEEFNKEKEKLIEALKADKKSLDAIAGRVGSALSYGKNHAYGEFITEETLNNITFEDVLEYHKKYFKPNNSYLVVIGDVDYKEIKSLISEKFGAWKKGKSHTDPIPELTANVNLTEINFIDLPTATQSSISVTNNVDLKMNDEEYHAALITNNILGGGGEGYLFKNLREDKGYTYGAYSSLGSSRYGVSRFTAGAKVRNVVTDSAVVEIIKEINRIKTETVDAELLKNAKAKYVGNFIRRLESPQTIANYALNIKLNDLPKDFYETYLEKINAVSAEDVKRVANRYFNYPNGTRIIVVGKGSDVADNLTENVGWPVTYFDHYANSIAKPVFNKAIPEGLTASKVMNNYINSIGGRDLLESVNTLVSKAEVTIPGAPFRPQMTMKQMAPNKSSTKMEVNMNGQKMTLMKSSFDGETGYTEGQGQRKAMDDKQIDRAKAVKGIFEELYYSEDEIELMSINSIDFKDAYKVKITEGEKISYRYYGVDSGLLLSVEEQDDNNNIVSTNYSDYRDVNGIKFPFSTEIPSQKLELNITEILINEELKDSDF
ncbi:MAG: peptidase M16 [Flavobacteriaceae bacterium]|nr:peptidase M16 [Flavobacteriaceae bacterium]|tara:strand:- start:1010 stop:3085 length:2076 start_codon:yes stop_codon:yes gene_type:complete